MIRVILADDHVLFTDGLELVLSRSGRFEVTGKINHPLDLLDYMQEHPCDLLLLDIQMPGLDGIELLKRIPSRFPDTRVVIISMHEEDDFIHEVLLLGASGFIAKSTESSLMLDMLQRVAAGEKVFPKARRRPAQHQLFTEREVEILRLIGKGKNNMEIADHLYITVHTVKTHRRNMLRRHHAANTSQLLKIGFENNLL
jgi:DNA-binding NarL/FixJ family response regulator